MVGFEGEHMRFIIRSMAYPVVDRAGQRGHRERQTECERPIVLSLSRRRVLGEGEAATYTGMELLHRPPT